MENDHVTDFPTFFEIADESDSNEAIPRHLNAIKITDVF